MELSDLQQWISENKGPMENYKKYLTTLCDDLVPCIINNTKDKDLDLVNKGKVQLLLQLIKQLS